MIAGAATSSFTCVEIADAAPITVPTIDKLSIRVLIDQQLDQFLPTSTVNGVIYEGPGPGRSPDARNVLHNQWGLSIGASLTETIWDGFNFLVRLASADEVRRLSPDLTAIAPFPCAGVIVTALGNGGYDCVNRYFAPAKGIPEDPVTGGAHCALTPFWAERLGRTELRAYQASSRGGELGCRLRGDRVELEESCVFYLEGLAQW